MQDRVPTPGQEGRVLITPESGSPYYAKIQMADNPTQAGTPLNKSTLLKDATAGLYGLGSDAVPDDVLAFLGKYSQYWWKRTAIISSGHYEISIGDPSLRYLVSGVYDNQSAATIEIGTVSLSGSNIVFTATSTISVSYSTYTNANSLKGKYFRITSGNNQGGPYYMAPDAPNATNGRSGSKYYVQATFSTLSSQYIEEEIGDTGYVQSSDRDAYPDSGESGGYEYQFLGVPFDNAVEAPKIATGSYVGTGKYGASNPNTLTFDFEPKLVMVVSQNSYSFGKNSGIAWMGQPGTSNGIIFTLSGNSLSWYSSDGTAPQLNNDSFTYYYFALG